jgi:archaellum component FlaF (FlaF/FlaG flagellin family)
MNKLPKKKRDHLIFVGMGTVLVLIGIGYGLIRPLYATIAAVNSQTSDARKTLQKMEDEIKTTDTISAQLVDLTETLNYAQSDMASGDPTSWIYDTIRNFKGKYKVDILVNGQLVPGEVDLLPKFPYRQLRVTVNGMAYYHDLGKFIADFENAYPHARIANLALEPAGGPGDNNEKLSFRMDIIALINPTAPQS